MSKIALVTGASRGLGWRRHAGSAGGLPEATEAARNGPVDAAMFRRTFDTNLFGAVSVVERFLPLLRRSSAGRIVNVSSTMGSLADQLDPASPYHGVVVPAYQGSKAALNAFTIALSKTLADTAIKVNSVCPGWLQTGLGKADNRAARGRADGIVRRSRRRCRLVAARRPR